MSNEKKISLSPLKFDEAIADILKGETILPGIDPDCRKTDRVMLVLRPKNRSNLPLKMRPRRAGRTSL